MRSPIPQILCMPTQARHYLAAEVYKTATRLYKTNGKKYALMFRWTAGHTAIPENEEADEEAKKAVEGTSSHPPNIPKVLRKPLKISKSVVLQEIGKVRKPRWKREWVTLPRYKKFKNIDSSLPPHKFIKLISNTKISRSSTSKIFQLRSGHVPLNAYLFQFKRKESTQCLACSTQKETPQHYLVECPMYVHKMLQFDRTSPYHTDTSDCLVSFFFTSIHRSPCTIQSCSGFVYNMIW